MGFFAHVLEFVKTNWVQMLAALYGFEMVLKAVSIMTPWKVDDKVSDFIEKWLPKLPKNL